MLSRVELNSIRLHPSCILISELQFPAYLNVLLYTARFFIVLSDHISYHFLLFVKKEKEPIPSQDPFFLLHMAQGRKQVRYRVIALIMVACQKSSHLNHTLI